MIKFHKLIYINLQNWLFKIYQLLKFINSIQIHLPIIPWLYWSGKGSLRPKTNKAREISKSSNYWAFICNFPVMGFSFLLFRFLTEKFLDGEMEQNKYRVWLKPFERVTWKWKAERGSWRQNKREAREQDA